MELCFGGYVERVAEHAARLGARAIVVQGDGMQSAKAPGLAHRTGVPVLVARKPSPAKRIVACTDLRDTRYPVLRCAAELATKLHAPVMAVHNIPVLNLVGDFGGIPLTHWFKSTSLVHCTTQLMRASEQLAVTAIPIVLNELNSVDAILQQARAFEADLIVAGTYGRNWCARALTGSVAADLVARSPRSVLLTPLSGAPAHDALS
jgi:nucleotide-binding universal stress UspA family protein